MSQASFNDYYNDIGRSEQSNREFDNFSLVRDKTHCKRDKIKIIYEPNNHDILSGRGNHANRHIGNFLFRYMVESVKQSYKSSPTSSRREVAINLLRAIKKLNPPGRFLTPIAHENLEWKEIDDNQAILKISQALREPKKPEWQIEAQGYLHELRDVIKPCSPGDEELDGEIACPHTPCNSQNIKLISNEDNFSIMRNDKLPSPDLSAASNIREEDQDIKQEDYVDIDADGDETNPFPSRHNPAAVSVAAKTAELRTQQQITLAIACIGKAFHDSVNDEKETDLIFRDVTDVESYGLLSLPGIVSSLCKRIVDLEDRISDGN